MEAQFHWSTVKVLPNFCSRFTCAKAGKSIVSYHCSLMVAMEDPHSGAAGATVVALLYHGYVAEKHCQ